MGKIYLVRHGQTDGNITGRIQNEDTRLNETGKKQAEEAAKFFEGKNISHYYSSPYTRAYQTAEIIAGYPLNIIKTPEFRERYFGDMNKYSGRTLEEILEENQELKELFIKNPFGFKTPTGESIIDVRKRVVPAFKNIINKHGTENIMIVSHGIVMKNLLTYMSALPFRAFLVIREPENCEIIDIDWNGEIYKISYDRFFIDDLI